MEGINQMSKKSKAFERNIFKKPVLKNSSEVCPNCKEFVSNRHAYIETYCEMCGQALDWRDIINTLRSFDNE
jgi:predicted RNA-binding Zn-ribbon protein involved in translation (DUF1610 family)